MFREFVKYTEITVSTRFELNEKKKKNLDIPLATSFT